MHPFVCSVPAHMPSDPSVLFFLQVQSLLTFEGARSWEPVWAVCLKQVHQSRRDWEASDWKWRGGGGGEWKHNWIPFRHFLDLCGYTWMLLAAYRSKFDPSGCIDWVCLVNQSKCGKCGKWGEPIPWSQLVEFLYALADRWKNDHEDPWRFCCGGAHCIRPAMTEDFVVK